MEGLLAALEFLPEGRLSTEIKETVTVHVPYREVVKRDGAGAPRRWQATALPR
jgi:hypothetical protein